MNSGLRKEINRWDREVEAEAERLIHNGIPPYDAIQKARGMISVRRRKDVKANS